MGLRERVYRVLVVSAAENFNAAITTILPESVYQPILSVTSVAAAKRAVSESMFDIVFINSPLPDDTGIRFAIDLCALKETVALLVVKSDIHGDVYDRVVEYGVFTMAKPFSKAALLQALGWITSTRERLRSFEKKTVTIEEKMKEIREINRAKWLLIGERGMSEPEAHRYIEKQAMDCCISRQEVAEGIIRGLIG